MAQIILHILRPVVYGVGFVVGFSHAIKDRILAALGKTPSAPKWRR